MSTQTILIIAVGFVGLIAYFVFEYWWGRREFPSRPPKSGPPVDGKRGDEKSD
jgi:hypothetical protein